jgi:DNA polymerase
MAQAVRRDIQKMKTRLRFRPVHVPDADVQVAWYEPAHHVCETVGAWLAKQDPGSHWILLTPDRSMRWDGKHLLSAPPVTPRQSLAAAPDDQWSRVVAGLSWT